MKHRNWRFYFEKKTSKTTDGCWVWQGSLNSSGYGNFNFPGAGGRAHRAAYLMFVGSIPNGLWVLHSCDNRACVRPEHLRLGTVVDNSRDRQERGRSVGGDAHWTHLRPADVCRGETQGNVRLTAADVLRIRERHADGESVHDLALVFGVGATATSKIVRGLQWSHVGGPIRRSYTRTEVCAIAREVKDGSPELNNVRRVSPEPAP